MKSKTYKLSLLNRLLSHQKGRHLTIGDYGKIDVDQLVVHVRSGDYFVTLATAIDLIRQELNSRDASVIVALEEIIDELLYLQQNYKITQNA